MHLMWDQIYLLLHCRLHCVPIRTYGLGQAGVYKFMIKKISFYSLTFKRVIFNKLV